jgi:very-short-patch-repair endonuclease
LAIEADGDEHHAGALDRAADASRDERCRALGWTIRRFTTEEIREQPAAVAAVIATLLRTSELAKAVVSNYSSGRGS